MNTKPLFGKCPNCGGMPRGTYVDTTLILECSCGAKGSISFGQFSGYDLSCIRATSIGMRAHFAGQIAAGTAANLDDSDMTPQQIAAWSVDVADALIEQLSQRAEQ